MAEPTPYADLGSRKVYTLNGKKFEVPQRYSVIKTIGYGAYGLVCSATEGKEKRAIKKCHKVFRDVGDAKRVLREIKLLKMLKHENLLCLQEAYVAGDEASFQDVYIVTDFLDTDMNTVIRSKQRISEDHLKYFIYQILRGMKYVHSAGVVHRDLKPANILVNINCDVKICDFGLARGVGGGSKETQVEMTDYVVTRWYRPPEILLMNKHYSYVVDVWSIGCIFAELVQRRPLFAGKDYLSQLSMICETLGSPNAASLGFVEKPEAQAYLLSLENKPRRPFSSFLAVTGDAESFLERMLEFEPEKRATTEELLAHPFMGPLHDAADEPTSQLQFKWEHDTNESLTEVQLRKLFVEEMTVVL